MAGRGKVFISHAAEDVGRLRQLLALFDTWGVDYWFEAQGQSGGEQLGERVQLALSEAAVLLRVCTPAVKDSFWMGLELGAFLSLQADDQRAGRAGQRTLVNLILLQEYERQPFDYANTLIDAARQPAAEWINALRAALGLTPLAPQAIAPITFADAKPEGQQAESEPKVSRRRVLVAGAGVVALGAAGATGVLLVTRRNRGGGGGTPTPTVLVPKASGDVIWKQPVHDQIVASAAVANGMVYIGALDNTLYAFSTDGKLKWTYPPTGHSSPVGKGIYAKPAVADGVVYIYGNNDHISALDAGTGAVRWTTAPPTGKGTAAYGYASPVLANGALYVASYQSSPGSMPGVLQGLDAATGAELPGYALNTFVTATPRSAGDVLYTAPAVILDQAAYTDNFLADGYLYALDTKNGLAELWKTHIGEVDFSSPAIVDGVAYVCTSAPDTGPSSTPVPPDNPSQDRGYLQAIDLTTHAILWRFGAGKLLTSSPFVASGLAYFGADDHAVYAIEIKTGKQQWSYPTGGRVPNAPVLANGVLYAGSADKAVHAIDPQSGNLVRKYTTDGKIFGAPVVQDGVLYIGSADKYMYAFKV